MRRNINTLAESEIAQVYEKLGIKPSDKRVSIGDKCVPAKREKPPESREGWIRLSSNTKPIRKGS